jgi:predicted RNA-binding Zn-ribbon protein involved in translation (DUF1610 family)
MAESAPLGSAKGPTLRVASRDVDEGRVQLESAVAIHTCPSCHAELADRYHFDCPECGHERQPSSRCRSCGGELASELIEYVAEAVSGGSVVRLLPGVSCRSCASVGVEGHELADLESLAALASTRIEILPERGIASSERLEVLADADVCGSGEPEEIVKRRERMTLRIGEPSALFEAALSVVTRHDPKDIFSPTLSLEPGPPYTPEQRRTVHRLLAEIQRELGTPVTCWSASVGLSEEPLVDPVLTEQLMSWHGDADGSALALYHAIVAGGAPGRFAGSVRLLARVVGAPPERSDSAPGAPSDLGQLLRERIRALANPPLSILQQLWLAIHPGRAFDEEQLYASIQAFHERYAAMPALPGPLLPWEEPDFEGYAAWLRRLTSALLAPEPSEN